MVVIYDTFICLSIIIRSKKCKRDRNLYENFLKIFLKRNDLKLSCKMVSINININLGIVRINIHISGNISIDRNTLELKHALHL